VVSHCSTNNDNPILMAITRSKSDIYTGLWVHPKRASALGIKSGDTVNVTNVRSGQAAQIKAYVTPWVHEEAVFMYSGYGAQNKALGEAAGVGTPTNAIIDYRVDPVVAGFRSQEFTVRLARV
jgi:anaerobic selenocysteine-containing dehydrogenase